MARGGAREGAGRKKMQAEKKRGVQVALRLSLSEKAELEKRANEAGVSVSKYLFSKVFD